MFLCARMLYASVLPSHCVFRRIRTVSYLGAGHHLLRLNQLFAYLLVVCLTTLLK